MKNNKMLIEHNVDEFMYIIINEKVRYEKTAYGEMPYILEWITVICS